jgi:hypothetical protein
MTSANRTRWLGCVILAGVLYGFVGIVFALPSSHLRFWRLAAWAVSGVVYASHIGYEQLRLRNSRVDTALHAALSAGLGGLLLGVGAMVHAATVPTHAPYWRFLIAMVVWPIITFVPALLVALVITFVLAYVPRTREAD